MTQFPVSTCNEQTLHAALELSKNRWLLAIQVPGRDRPSLLKNSVFGEIFVSACSNCGHFISAAV